MVKKWDSRSEKFIAMFLLFRRDDSLSAGCARGDSSSLCSHIYCAIAFRRTT